ncbi:exonuclease domain-containing protein [Pseudomonas sp. SP16.1]|uniref:exonuclease domain-containing protein n=1 Tax=Pseudomonas sp. SP16.1 TaxID=3458854 RepID=UPI003AE57797
MGVRYLLCVDLEATCDSSPGFEQFMEAIEIGAVMLDLAKGEPVAEFSSFIRPTIKPLLTPFCMELTTITQRDVDSAPGYLDVLAAVNDFLQPFGDEWLWCSWGNYDRNQLIKDGQLHGLAPLLPPARHINLKRCFAKEHRSKMVGLRQAARQLQLEWVGTHHRGIDDARNVGQVAMHMLEAQAGQLLQALGNSGSAAGTT